ncbi:hypothetical protein [Paraburkholderia azotifigens]|uniref:Uncharacterized protein n=2 Tax=Paraburkholderia azotifigens TaxID=2057004 RepID=A0A5C6VCW2_9BURK|nr:hypothetical protein [Paraburkholderia azotifigens]TXC82644.1 hypothetical protein FRZ40_19535 [Paraburkholderia azotifigens]
MRSTHDVITPSSSGHSDAVAWAWAASKTLMPGEEMIRNVDHDGDGEDIRVARQMRACIGVHGRAHAGFCASCGRAGDAGWPSLFFVLRGLAVLTLLYDEGELSR